MHRFGKSSIWTAAGFAFVSGLLLLPTQSSAQYINIEGMIRGALQGGGFQPYNGGGGGGGGDGYVRRRGNSAYTTPPSKSQPKKQEPPPPSGAGERGGPARGRGELRAGFLAVALNPSLLLSKPVIWPRLTGRARV